MSLTSMDGKIRKPANNWQPLALEGLKNGPVPRHSGELATNFDWVLKVDSILIQISQKRGWIPS